MTGDREDLDRRLAAALERLTQAVRVLRWDAAHAHGLSPVQLSLLEILSAAPPGRRRVSALAAELDLSAPTVSEAVGALRRKGLARTQPWSGRGHLIEITDDGRALLPTAGRWDAALMQVLAGLPSATAEATLATTLDIIAGLQELGVVTVTRMCTTCRFFDRRSAVPRCNLLEAPLPPAALRVDCPEHEPAA